MRRVVPFVAVAVVALAGFAFWSQRAAIEAQETHTIALDVVRFGVENLKEGEPCAIPAINPVGQRYTVSRFTERIVVSDPDGAILAMVPLEGVAADVANAGRWPDCEVSLSITVPDAPFYVLTLGGDHLMTIARDELPFTDPLPRVIVE